MKLVSNGMYLERGLSRLVPGDALHDAPVHAADVGNHESVIAALVHQHLVRVVVAHLSSVDVPRDLGVRPTGHPAVEPRHLALRGFAVVANADKVRSESLAALGGRVG